MNTQSISPADAPDRFVVLEGLSGAGKSTLLRALADTLRNTFGRERVVLTREPWRRTSTVENDLVGAELLDFVVRDRRAHLRQLIRPALEANQWVVSSRYYLSTLVYQGYLDGLGLERCWRANKEFLTPGLSVFLYADEKCIERRLGERLDLSRFERREYRARERYAYLEAVSFLRARGHRILALDTTHAPPEDLVTEVTREVLL